MNSSPRENAADLRARALRALARREHSRLELERKLAPHAETKELLDVVLSELEGRQLLSNHRFAETRARILARKYGAARIRRELQSKGVSREEATRASSAVNELENARAVLARRYHAPATTREERAKRARFLQQRGFSFDVIHRLSSRDEE